MKRLSNDGLIGSVGYVGLLDGLLGVAGMIVDS